jgi:hypothetical protein
MNLFCVSVLFFLLGVEIDKQFNCQPSARLNIYTIKLYVEATTNSSSQHGQEICEIHLRIVCRKSTHPKKKRNQILIPHIVSDDCFWLMNLSIFIKQIENRNVIIRYLLRPITAFFLMTCVFRKWTISLKLTNPFSKIRSNGSIKAKLSYK